jgi:dTDP-4-dehydrorhamnose reductase
MRILITGASGNVGRGLLTALEAQGHEVIGTTHATLDITDFHAVSTQIEATAPELVIHAAAMTAVDRCAEQPDEALRINALGTQNVAVACGRVGAAMCYLSTNEVFNGERNTPILEYEPTSPANPYGYSKWMGEQMVRSLLPQHYIVRTSWVFAHGGSNFVQKIVSAAESGRALSVVIDEIACPTYADDLIAALVALVETQRYGIYHFVNEGVTSRYEFARYALDCFGLTDVPIQRIVKSQWQRPSRPPTYSALRNFLGAQNGITLRPWQAAVEAFVDKERQQVQSGS